MLNHKQLEQRNINLQKSVEFFTNKTQQKFFQPDKNKDNNHPQNILKSKLQSRQHSKRHRRLKSNPKPYKHHHTENSPAKNQNYEPLTQDDKNELKDYLIFYSPRQEIPFPFEKRSSTYSRQSQDSVLKFSIGGNNKNSDKKHNYSKFAAFKDFTDSQSDFFKTCNSFKNTTHYSQNFFKSEKQTLLELQLYHNQSQVQMLKNDLQSNRNSTYKNILNDMQATRQLQTQISKRTRVTEKNPYKVKKPYGYMNFPDGSKDPQQQIFKELMKQPQEEKPEDEEDPFLSNQVIEWLKIPNRTYLNRPTFREGAAMFTYHKNLFLSAGRSDKLTSEFFQYEIKTGVWKQLDTLPQQKRQEQRPSARMGHSINLYGNNAIFFGGEGDYDTRTKKRNNSNHIHFLSLKTFTWSILQTSVTNVEPRRNHSASIFGNYFYISGGVDNSEHYIDKMLLVNLDNGRCREYPIPFGKGLAFHRQFSVFKKILNPAGKQRFQKVKEEGIYIWGGKNSKEKCSSDLHILKLDDHHKPNEWKKPSTLGQPPPGRLQHTIDYYQRTNSLIIYGGVTAKGDIFNDIWFLRLSSLEWVQMAIKGTEQINRYGHCSSIHRDKLYIFGGITEHKYATWDLHYFNLDSDIRQNKDGTEFKEMQFNKNKIVEAPFENNPEDFNIALEEKQSPMLKSKTKKIFSNFLKKKLNLGASGSSTMQQSFQDSMSKSGQSSPGAGLFASILNK